jgi:serine/threonine protein phosphatase PrpC
VRVRVGVASDIGRLRERNEDSFLADEPLFAVADGMGGHRGGNVASSLAIETLQVGMKDGVPDRLLESVKWANLEVLERGESDRDLRGMGTTLTALVADGDKAHLVHVGDSRAYLLREGQLQQLTEDHTLVRRMVREGRLTEEEAEHHPQRSILTRALGVDSEVEADPLTLDILPADRILLCTDGLTAMVDRDRIQEILLHESDPQAACEQLVAAANQAGGEDNITVLILDFEEGQAAVNGGRAATVAAESNGALGPAAEAAPAIGAQADPDGGGIRTAVRAAPPRTADNAPPAEQLSGRGLRKFALWTALIVALAVAAALGIRAYVHHQWYVGDSAGRVAIYNGIPTKVLGMHLSHVRQTTELSSQQAETLAPWRSLRDGITADSLSAARAIVDQIRRDLQRLQQKANR